MTGLRCFVFDLDGTLADTREANLLAYQTTFAALGMPLTRAEYDEYFGLGVGDMVRRHAPRHGLEPDESLIAASIERKAREYPRHMSLVRAVEPAASILRAVAGTHLTALATTARRTNGRAVIERLGMGELFDTEVYGEDVERTKPAPDCYQEVARRLGVEPEECAVLEDSIAGIQAAQAFGARILQVIP